MRMKLLDCLAKVMPKLRTTGQVVNPARKTPNIWHTNCNQICRINRTDSAIPGRGRTGHSKSIFGHLGQHAPLPERPRIVCARPNVGVSDQFSYHAATNVVAQYELARHVTNKHRIATSLRSEPALDRLGVQPRRSVESILTDLANDGFVVENRPTCGGFYGLSQRFAGERSILAFFSILATFIVFFPLFL